MNQIRQYFEKIVAITDVDWEFFSSKLVRNSFAANHILLNAGEIENYLSFVEKGTLRYYIPKDEGEQTVDFAFANNFLSAYGSFITQSPSVYVIETLTDTVVWSIRHLDLQQVYLKTDIGNTIGRLASEQLYLNKRNVKFLC